MTDVDFANSARTMIGVQCLVLDLKTFSNSEDFIFTDFIFHNFAAMFFMDSAPKKPVREFLVGRWTPIPSSWTKYSKNWKISFTIVSEMLFLFL